MTAAGGNFIKDGWMRLPFRFSAKNLAKFSKFEPHIGRGSRLSDMDAVTEVLPTEFKTCLKGLGFHPAPNRAIGFVKSNTVNWSLPWHQDRVIAMPRKTENPDYFNWTLKSGIWHCEPSENILRHMAFAYIAFDDIPEGTGGLELAERTHLQGKILQSDIARQLAQSNLIAPNMSAGDVLLVYALTLHRSALWSGGERRRTLRLDFTRHA